MGCAMSSAILFQVPLPTQGDNPWIYMVGVAVVVVGLLFVRNEKSVDRLIAEKEDRATRCETGYDKVLEDNRSQANTIKEQSTTLSRVASVTEEAFAMAKTTADKIDDNRRAIEALRRDARAKS